MEPAWFRRRNEKHARPTARLITTLFLQRLQSVPRQKPANSPAEASATPVAPQPVFMSIQVSGNGIIINWSSGPRQSATNIIGPWNDLGAAMSPYGVTPTESQRFYRVKMQ